MHRSLRGCSQGSEQQACCLWLLLVREKVALVLRYMPASLAELFFHPLVTGVQHLVPSLALTRFFYLYIWRKTLTCRQNFFGPKLCLCVRRVECCMFIPFNIQHNKFFLPKGFFLADMMKSSSFFIIKKWTKCKKYIKNDDENPQSVCL